MGFYPQIANIQANVVAEDETEATGGLAYYDVDAKTTKYAFQATISPFTNEPDNSFEFKINDNLEVFKKKLFTDDGGFDLTSSFSASFDVGGRSQVIGEVTESLDLGLYLQNQFITESLSGSFAIYDTQITASRGLNLFHRYMSGSLTQSLHLTASEGLYATGSSYFKGTFDITDAVTLGDTLTVSGDVTGSSNLRVTGDSKLVGGVVADSTVSIGDTLTVTSDITGSSNLRVVGTSKLVGDVEADGNVTVGGNLTVQGTTTTISSSNTTFQDPIIGLGITGSETFNDVGDRGIVFGRGASQSDALPGIWWDGTQFNLAKSATSPLSSSFGSISSYSPIRVGTLTLDGTLVTSTAAELNILDGATVTFGELNLLDGASAGTVVNSKAVIYGSSGEINGTTITATGGLSGSLTQLSNGSSYLVEGSNITITSGSNGQITISSTGGGGGGGLSNIVEDTTPQLGGHLDINGKTISGSLLPATAGSYDLGSTTNEWGNLYLNDSGKIYFGDDQDIYIKRRSPYALEITQDNALGGDPEFWLVGNSGGTGGPTLLFYQDSSSPASGDDLGQVQFYGKNSINQLHFYSEIFGEVVSTSNGNERGSVKIDVIAAGASTNAINAEGSTTSGISTVDIPDHNGSTGGLKLGGTLVTSTATELNLLDTSSISAASGSSLKYDGSSLQWEASSTDTSTVTYSSKSSSFTAEDGYHYGVNTTSGNIVATIPAASSNANAVIRFKIKTGTNSLILDASGSDTIDGLATVMITDNKQAISLISDGSSDWEIF